jgi:hypothetical protein
MIDRKGQTVERKSIIGVRSANTRVTAGTRAGAATACGRLVLEFYRGKPAILRDDWRPDVKGRDEMPSITEQIEADKTLGRSLQGTYHFDGVRAQKNYPLNKSACR